MDRLYGKTVSPEPMMQSTKLPVPMACRETTAQKQMIALINSVPETNKQIEPIPFFFSAFQRLFSNSCLRVCLGGSASSSLGV